MQPILQLLRFRHAFAICVLLILGFAFISRSYRLSSPTQFFFDEVYHGFTATTYLHNDPKGYEYWQTPPQGVAYEWTHPPLAKLLMAGSMKIVGENSFGWRLSSVVFGTGVIAMTGLLAYELFGRKFLTLAAMTLATLDGLLLSMSRIAMNDMHFLFFALAGVLAYVKFRRIFFSPQQFPLQLKFLSLSALCLGLALASKWTALYVGAALATDFWLAMIGRMKFPIKTILAAVLLFGTLVPTVYFLSYSQFFFQGHTLKQFKETQQQMWWYHTGLKATHGYQSRPWQWVLDLRPVWMHVDYAQNANGVLSHIYNAGNPLGFWVGAASMVSLTALVLHELIKRAQAWLNQKKTTDKFPFEIGFVVLLYMFLWLPWQFSPRIMFFYHYAPAVPLLSIVTAWIATKLYDTGSRGQLIALCLLFAIGIVFVVLYPLNTGFPMPTAYFERLFSLFPMWK